MLPGSMPPHTCFRIVLKPLWRSGPQAERRCRIEGAGRSRDAPIFWRRTRIKRKPGKRPGWLRVVILVSLCALRAYKLTDGGVEGKSK